MGIRHAPTILPGLLLAMLAAAPAGAAQPRGKTIVTQGIGGKVAPCASCHQANGHGGGNGTYPRLAGLPAPYIRAQLEAFRSGQRSNAIMHGIASGLSDPDIRAVAAWFAGRKAPWPAPPGGAKAAVRAGQELVAAGDPARDVPACQDCHGPGLRGGGPDIPPLAGQWQDYLEKQLQAFADGSRPGGPLDLMGRIAHRLSAKEMHDASMYIAGLRPGQSVEIPRGGKTSWKPKPQSPDSFTPPPEPTMPTAGKYGRMVQLGEKIFMDTPRYAGKYVGNSLSCRNCHTGRGRTATSSPMWAAVPMYPKYRGKNDRVNTLQMRIQGCFRYSENGKAPPPDGRVLVALSSYMHWLATGMPIGIKPKASGYPKVTEPAAGFDRDRGRKVYASHCAVCHGDHGQGRVVNGARVFPALWGPQSFNWGAGMHRVNTAAAFIKHNMPFSDGGSLSDQQAWDVAAWIASQPRPQDPRFNGDLAATAKRFHKHRKYDYYGRKLDGHTLGAPGTLGAWEKKHRASD
ncbi:MAG TPA: c-type cytochrome [Gammaproteobacteria bacterium]|nr:c-type cytochrome [Gammaproteobacteria bacterium]